ncbi:MAG: glycine--tRNA ligase subunit beta [Gammaproteobacteria bacterium]|nr:glycine--tRNA ligase subunit beta [Gammaproteobacteria bacterium]
MSEKRSLLIEIGTEELPPKSLKRLSDALGAGVVEGMRDANLHFGEVTLYATPRRLAMLVKNVDLQQPDKQTERRGPAVKAAFDADGNPTKAVQGFARGCGVEVAQLEQIETAKGAWLVYHSEQKGEATAKLIPAIVQSSLDKLPIPKRMRWGSLNTEFVRPAHWVVMLLGSDVLAAEILGIKAGRESRGHRFHHPATLSISEPEAYAPLLESEGYVVADFAVRREAVRAQILSAAAKLNGSAVIDEELLDEVTSMVEWPRAVAGDFDARFLEVPAEALITTMKSNQKYFHLVDEQGKLMPHFITISNIASNNPNAVKEGNERVIRPRLADADFFWKQDRKHTLQSHLQSLESVVFQNKLGTLYDKSRRIENLARELAADIGCDSEQAARAALLSKCDLMTNMVGEFPDLQGVMGRYYATHDGESNEVACALDEQYRPRFAGDQLPEGGVGQAVAIADKLDTLVGIFAIGEVPTGDKDPFALRRAALGVLRILIEKERDIDLMATLRKACATFHAQQGTHDLFATTDTSEKVATAVFDFMMERLRGYFHDKGYQIDEFEAVSGVRPTRPHDFAQRIEAVRLFRTLPEATSLAAANKRIHNILKKVAGTLPEKLDAALLVETQEQALADAVDELSDEVHKLFDNRDYPAALSRLARLREPVDNFFDHVMVMAEDEALRNNRLALLNRLQTLFLRVADLSRLQ